MSDVGSDNSLTYSRHGKDVGDSYDYPNINTYRAIRGNGASLRKGAIFGLGLRKVDVTVPPVFVDTGSARNTTTTSYQKTIDTQYFKRFQFNPVTLQMATQFVPVEDATDEQSGGGAASVSSMGAMTTSIELMFSRETETFRATNGNLGGGRMNQAAAAVYARIGVMKDIYDLYRVILANGDDQANGAKDISLPDDMTLTALTGKAFDLARAGSKLFNRAVGIIFSPDMVIYGNVTGLNVVFKKWNANLVPTVAVANITLEVMSARPSTAALTSTSTTTTTSSSGGGGGVGSGGGGGSSGGSSFPASASPTSGSGAW